MNLSSIVVLLQLVLSLLSSPSTAHSTQAQVLATQAIGYATQALQEMSVPASNPTLVSPPPSNSSQNIGYSNPIYIPPASNTNIGAPDLATVTPPIDTTPSCTISGTRIIPSNTNEQERIDFVWSSKNIDSGTTGWLRSSYKGGTPLPDFNYGYGNGGFAGNGIMITSLSGERTDIQWSGSWRLSFGNVYCYATVN